MKEIGRQFKEKREEIGITVEEVSNDLAKDVVLVENLENGNHKVFKDVIELKDMIRQYAKYLGLDDEEMLEEVNDFLFETTSKISVADIQDRLREIEEKKEKEENNKVRTPYTIEYEPKKKNGVIYMIILILLIILVIFYVLLRMFYL